MKMRLNVSLFVALAASSLFGAAPARADTNYPWCAIYYNGDGVTSCSYETEAQCKLTISGIGGTCSPNAAYNPSLPMDPMTATPPPAPPIPPRR